MLRPKKVATKPATLGSIVRKSQMMRGDVVGRTRWLFAACVLFFASWSWGQSCSPAVAAQAYLVLARCLLALAEQDPAKGL